MYYDMLYFIYLKHNTTKYKQLERPQKFYYVVVVFLPVLLLVNKLG